MDDLRETPVRATLVLTLHDTEATGTFGLRSGTTWFLCKDCGLQCCREKKRQTWSKGKTVRLAGTLLNHTGWPHGCLIQCGGRGDGGAARF